jgi:hypothetical protein
LANTLENSKARLIEIVTDIVKEDDRIQCDTGGYFNLMSILNVERREVSTHSAFIFELLNPAGSHCQKDAYLKLFIEKVLQIDDFDYSTASVYKEKFAGEFGRIDILIESSNYKIVIEVKIDAGDQYHQIQRYFEYLNKVKNNRQIQKIYYLTLEGSGPSDVSYGELDENSKQEIKLISFKKDIHTWLEDCINYKVIAKVNSAIVQYIDLIRKITNSFNNEVENKVKNIIIDSVENYKAALSIANTISDARQYILDEFFTELKNKLSQSPIIKDLVEEENLDKYYNMPKNRYAHLTYLLKETNYKDINIYLCIELEWRLCFTICVAKVTKDGNIDWNARISNEKYNIIKNDYLGAFEEILEESKATYCLGWSYLKTKKQKLYNFYEAESEYNVEELVDKKLLKSEIDNIYNELHEAIATILK